jgi:chromosome segregation ATPase
MDIDQVAKRLEWIDEERRKDKSTLAALQERILAVEGNIPSLNQQIKDLNSEITRLGTVLSRLDTFETTLAQTRIEFTRALETAEKQRADHEREVEKVRRVELEGINKAIGEVRKGLDPIPDLRKGLQARQEEDFRLVRLIEETDQKVVDTKRYDEEYKHTLRLIEEGRRQDNKRLTDLQAEVAATRKRVDEGRGKVDITSDNLRKVEGRIGELLTAESERRQSQTVFVEKQTLAQVERERQWNDWQARFDIVEKSAVLLDSQVQTLDATQRSVKRSQDLLDDATQRFDRRVNEITEVQRLAEERFRQEWVTFKADDQKRWTNYVLAQEEQQREEGRRFEKVTERLVSLEDLTQELQDVIHQINAEVEKRLQSLVVLAHEWAAAYENAFGRRV